MKYINCPLNMLQSKKQLKKLLHITDARFLRQEYVASLVQPRIDSTPKPRLIEAPQIPLKDIQRRIKWMLDKIEIPENVFSGIKGRSYIDNAIMHIGKRLRYLYKTDFTAFFPSIRREFVYNFFRDDLQCSPDVSEILTNLTTIDVFQADPCYINEVMPFLREKGVASTNHLISGAPTSSILSYLVNHRMFDSLQKLCNDNNVLMTVYVDDITFSSEHRLTKSFKRDVLETVTEYGYRISENKVKSYSKIYPKLITGVIIDAEGKPTAKNSLQKKIIDEFSHLRKNPDDTSSRQRLRGLVTVFRTTLIISAKP